MAAFVFVIAEKEVKSKPERKVLKFRSLFDFVHISVLCLQRYALHGRQSD